MRKLILFAIFAIYSLNVLASEKPTREEVIEYFKATHTLELLKGYSEHYVKLLREGYPKLDKNFYNDPEFIKTMETYDKKLLDECINIVKNNLNKSDLQEILTFLKTDLGKKFLKITKETDPLFLEASTRTNMWLNERVEKLLYKNRER